MVEKWKSEGIRKGRLPRAYMVLMMNQK